MQCKGGRTFPECIAFPAQVSSLVLVQAMRFTLIPYVDVNLLPVRVLDSGVVTLDPYVLDKLGWTVRQELALRSHSSGRTSQTALAHAAGSQHDDMVLPPACLRLIDFLCHGRGPRTDIVGTW